MIPEQCRTCGTRDPDAHIRCNDPICGDGREFRQNWPVEVPPSPVHVFVINSKDHPIDEQVAATLRKKMLRVQPLKFPNAPRFPNGGIVGRVCPPEPEVTRPNPIYPKLAAAVFFIGLGYLADTLIALLKGAF